MCNGGRPLYLEPNRRLIGAKYDFVHILFAGGNGFISGFGALIELGELIF